MLWRRDVAVYAPVVTGKCYNNLTKVVRCLGYSAHNFLLLMKKIVSLVKNYLDEREWNRLEPSDLAKSISIEAAELLEIFQWKNYSVSDLKDNPEIEEKLKKELADVMIYCMELGVHLELDLDKVIREKIAYNSKKYPAEEVVAHKGDSYEKSYYLERKMKYRKNSK